MAKIVLASGSPRRQELLRRMGITEFDIRVPEVEEYYPDHLSPEEIVKFISREKSDAAARLCGDDELVITADTMVFLDERRLGKPRDEAQALEMLTALAGRKHTVCTGVTVRRGAKICTAAQHTDVYFRPATERELRAYIRTGEPMDKAGAYGVQGKGALLAGAEGRVQSVEEKEDGFYLTVLYDNGLCCTAGPLRGVRVAQDERVHEGASLAVPFEAGESAQVSLCVRRGEAYVPVSEWLR